MTVREQMLELLRQNPDGMTKSALIKTTGTERGHGTAILNGLELHGDITVERRFEAGSPVHVCRAVVDYKDGRGTE